MTKKIKPRRGWYAVSVALLLLGMAGFISGLSMSLGLAGYFKPNLCLPGGAEILLKAGTNSIYYVYHIAYLLEEDVTFTFENTATGEVFYSDWAKVGTYVSSGKWNGELVAEVELPADGQYLVSGSGVQQGEELNFYVGNSNWGILFGSAMLIILGPLFFVGGITAFALILAVRHRKRHPPPPVPPAPPKGVWRG